MPASPTPAVTTPTQHTARGRTALLLLMASSLLWWGCGAHGPLQVVHSPTSALPPNTQAPPLTLPTGQATDVAPALRIASYNVNFGMAGSKAVAEAIRNSDAQVVFLQETTPSWQHFFAKELAAEYPHQHFLHAEGRYIAGGMAVLSRVAVDSGPRLPSSEGWFDAWQVKLQHGRETVSVLNVHLRPPLSDDGGVFNGLFSTRDDREREIIAHLAALDDQLPDVVVGDFNEGPRGWAVRHLQRRGYLRALALHDAEGATWHWTVHGFPIGAQLDHVLFRAKRFSCSYADILNVGDSDHLPLVADLQLKPQPQAHD